MRYASRSDSFSRSSHALAAKPANRCAGARYRKAVRVLRTDMLSDLNCICLSSVTFMNGYMAIGFDGAAAIAIFAWPLLTIDGEMLRDGMPRYAEVLPLLVGSTASYITETKDFFEIGFDNGVALQVRLDNANTR